MVIVEEVWWCLKITDGVSWWMLAFDDKCWCLVVIAEVWWCLMMDEDVVNDGVWCKCRSLMVIDKWCCFMMNVEVRWWMMKINGLGLEMVFNVLFDHKCLSLMHFDDKCWILMVNAEVRGVW